MLIFDFFLLLYFFSGITDVNWSSPLSVPLVFAAGLAAMITAVSYGCFAFAGHRLRKHKDHAGVIPPEELDWLTRLVVVACAAGVVVLALLMFARMRAEAVPALAAGSGATANVIAATLAVVSVLANILVIAVHALDGSEETARLDALGDAVSRPLTRAHRMRRRADRLDHVIAVRARKAHRVAARGISRARRPMAIGDEMIDTARAIHQRTAALSEATSDPNQLAGVVGYRLPDALPRAYVRPVRMALRHVDDDLPSEASAGGPPEEAGAGEPAE